MNEYLDKKGKLVVVPGYNSDHELINFAYALYEDQLILIGGSTKSPLKNLRY